MRTFLQFIFITTLAAITISVLAQPSPEERRIEARKEKLEKLVQKSCLNQSSQDCISVKTETQRILKQGYRKLVEEAVREANKEVNSQLFLETEAIREAECLDTARNKAFSLGIAFLPSETCKQVQKKIDDHLTDDAPIGTASGV